METNRCVPADTVSLNLFKQWVYIWVYNPHPVEFLRFRLLFAMYIFASIGVCMHIYISLKITSLSVLRLYGKCVKTLLSVWKHIFLPKDGCGYAVGCTSRMQCQNTNYFT